MELNKEEAKACYTALNALQDGATHELRSKLLKFIREEEPKVRKPRVEREEKSSIEE